MSVLIVSYFVQMCNLADILEIHINKIVLESFHDDNAGGEPPTRKKTAPQNNIPKTVLNICFLFVNVHTNNLHGVLKKRSAAIRANE